MPRAMGDGDGHVLGSRDAHELDMAALQAMVKDRRKRQSLRQTAEEIGISFSTLSRVEAGSQPDLTSFTRICAWLGVPPSMFFQEVTVRAVEPLEQALTHLRSDPRLTKEATASIASMLQQMYDVLAKEAQPEQNLVACHLRAAATMRPGVPTRLSSLLVDMHTGLEQLVAAGEL